MSAASGLEHLKPFLPGLESALEDSEVSEIMINGPGNVWVERSGRLAVHAAPDLDEAAGPRPVLCGSADTPENARPWAAGNVEPSPACTVRYRQERKLLAVEGLRNVLRTHRPPTVRTLEQKISDSGPFDQRIDPHVMTSVRKALENIGDIHDLSLSGGECLELQGAQH